MRQLWSALVDLALVFAVSDAVLHGLRIMARQLFAHIAASARAAGLLHTAVGLIGSSLIEAGIVVIAWGVDYATASSPIGDVGEMGGRQSLHLNVFLVMQLAKLALRAVLSPTTADWRLRAISDRGAKIAADRLGAGISVAGVVTFSFAIWLAISVWIDYRLNADVRRAPTSRGQTLLTLPRNAVTITLIVITTMFVLSELGIDIAPLLASAGVLGLAIGFGAQKLVQDIITGIFMQLE